MPSLTFWVPSTFSILPARSVAISWSCSRSFPLISICMPLPPRALISILEVETTTSQPSTSLVLFSISFSSCPLSSFLSSFSTRYMVTSLVELPPIDMAEPPAMAPMVSISSISEIFSMTSSAFAAVSFSGVPLSVVTVMLACVLSMDGKNSVPLRTDRYMLPRNKTRAPKSTQALCVSVLWIIRP